MKCRYRLSKPYQAVRTALQPVCPDVIKRGHLIRATYIYMYAYMHIHICIYMCGVLDLWDSGTPGPPHPPKDNNNKRNIPSCIILFTLCFLMKLKYLPKLTYLRIISLFIKSARLVQLRRLKTLLCLWFMYTILWCIFDNFLCIFDNLMTYIFYILWCISLSILSSSISLLQKTRRSYNRVTCITHCKIIKWNKNRQK